MTSKFFSFSLSVEVDRLLINLARLSLEAVINSNKDWFIEKMYELTYNGHAKFPLFPKVKDIFRNEIYRNIFRIDYQKFRRHESNKRPTHPNYLFKFQVVDAKLNVTQEIIHLDNIDSNLYYILAYGFFGDNLMHVDENKTLCVIVENVVKQWKDAIGDMLEDIVQDDVEDWIYRNYDTNIPNYFQYMIEDRIPLSEALLLPASEETIEYYCNEVVFAVEEMIYNETKSKLKFIQNKLGGDDHESPQFQNAPIVNFIFYK